MGGGIARDTSLDLSLLLYLYASPSTDGRWYHDACGGGVFSVVAGRPIDKSLPPRLLLFFSSSQKGSSGGGGFGCMGVHRAPQRGTLREIHQGFAKSTIILV